MKDKIQINDLLDIYGPLLTRRQQEIMALYYQEDYSYTEISELLQVSRAAVLDAVHRATAQLERYEAVVQYVHKKEAILTLCQKEKWEEIEKIL